MWLCTSSMESRPYATVPRWSLLKTISFWVRVPGKRQHHGVGTTPPLPSTPPVLAVPQTQRNLNLGQKLNRSLHRSRHSPGWQKTSILTNLRDDSPGKWGCINKHEIHPTVNISRSCKHSSGPTGTKKIRHYFSGTRILCQTKLFITAQAFNSSPGSKV